MTRCVFQLPPKWGLNIFYRKPFLIDKFFKMVRQKRNNSAISMCVCVCVCQLCTKREPVKVRQLVRFWQARKVVQTKVLSVKLGVGIENIKVISLNPFFLNGEKQIKKCWGVLYGPHGGTLWTPCIIIYSNYYQNLWQTYGGLTNREN